MPQAPGVSSMPPHHPIRWAPVRPREMLDWKFPNMDSLGRDCKRSGTRKENLLQVHSCTNNRLHKSIKFRLPNLDFWGTEGESSKKNTSSLLQYIRLQHGYWQHIFADCFLACPDGA